MKQGYDPLATFRAALAAGDDEAAEAAVGRFPADEPTLAALLTLASSDDSDERWWGLRGLVADAQSEPEHRDQTIPLLLAALEDAGEPLRCLAALGLGQLQVTEAIPALVHHLGDPSGWVRGAMSDGLAMMGEAALPALGEALQDPHEGVRVRAAHALHKIKSPQAARWLFPALSDDNQLVRNYAYETLNELGMLTTLLVS